MGGERCKGGEEKGGEAGPEGRQTLRTNALRSGSVSDKALSGHRNLRNGKQRKIFYS